MNTPTTLIILFTMLLLSILLILYTNSMSKHRKELEEEVESKKQQHRENTKLDTTVSLTKIEIDVLNEYDKCNIRVPIEIVEDLHNARLDNEKDIRCFIENQRYYWKLENTKKPLQRKQTKL